jgi:uncharacterized protein YnzC (UPF0291/DUF896 family)
MYNHKDSIKKITELMARKKVMALTKEIIELEAKEVDYSHQ